MAKSTRYKLTKDDPIFKEGTQAFVPAPRPPSGPRTISRAEINRVNAKMGITPLPADHPVYSEGPSITFSSRMPKQSEPKVIDSPLAQMQESLLQEMRGFGLTHEERAGSAGLEITASVPMGRRPKTKRPSLREAYRAARYSVDVEGCTYVLRVGQRIDDLAARLKSLGAGGAAFITAHNPASLQLGDSHNAMADRALRQDLQRAGAKAFKGSGEDPDGKWPAETSYLTTGLTRAEAERLARRYGQYAMLWIDSIGKVELIELVDLDTASRYPLKVPPFAWVELGFNWSNEWACLRLSPADWRRILSGEDFHKRTRCGHDGEMFTLDWGFSNGTDLYISYGDDGGTAYDGKLTGVSLTLEARK